MIPSANTARVANRRLRNASWERAEKSSSVLWISRVPIRCSPTTMGTVRVEVFAPAPRFSSPSTPRITYSFGPFFLLERRTRWPTFRGSVEAWTSSEVSAIDPSLTPSCRSFCANWSSVALRSPPSTAAGCSWKTSMAVERSSV